MSSGRGCHHVSSLDDWLADPLIRLVMRADNVSPAQIRQLYDDLLPRRAFGAAADGKLAIEGTASADFRSGVGIMLLNLHDEIFVGRRTGTLGEAWQMPQGGICEGEQPLKAALRELREEIGVDNVEVLAESDVWLRYELPPELIGKAWQGRWRGQQQKWFAMRFLGAEDEVNIATEHPEFSAWRWVPAAELPNLIVSFKRQLYLDVLRQFQTISAAGELVDSTGTNYRAQVRSVSFVTSLAAGGLPGDPVKASPLVGAFAIILDDQMFVRLLASC
jgi:putative (di)nucleoside polyphosphate hydrolase